MVSYPVPFWYHPLVTLGFAQNVLVSSITSFPKSRTNQSDIVEAAAVGLEAASEAVTLWNEYDETAADVWLRNTKGSATGGSTSSWKHDHLFPIFGEKRVLIKYLRNWKPTWYYAIFCYQMHSTYLITSILWGYQDEIFWGQSTGCHGGQDFWGHSMTHT